MGRISPVSSGLGKQSPHGCRHLPSRPVKADCLNISIFPFLSIPFLSFPFSLPLSFPPSPLPCFPLSRLCPLLLSFLPSSLSLLQFNAFYCIHRLVHPSPPSIEKHFHYSKKISTHPFTVTPKSPHLPPPSTFPGNH